MTTELHPGLPAGAYRLGPLLGIARPSARSWAMGILPAAGWWLGLTVLGLAFALPLLSEPFAFLLTIGWISFLMPILLPICGLYILGSHLFRNLRGRILVLTDGVVLVPRMRAAAKVYPWTAVRGFQEGNAAPPSQSGAESATVFAHGSSQFTVRMSDDAAWVFGSDLRGFPELREWFRQKAGETREPAPVAPVEPSAATDQDRT